MDEQNKDGWELRNSPGASKNWFKLYGKYGARELIARIYERGNRPGLEYVWQVGWLDAASGLLLDIVGSIYDFKSTELMLSLAMRFCDQAQSALLLEYYDSLKKVRTMHSFKPGDIVTFDPDHFNPNYWYNLSEIDRIKYYGWAGYGQNHGRKSPKLFVWMCPINDADGSDSGYCILVDMDDGHIEWMRHSIDFRKATEKEF